MDPRYLLHLVARLQLYGKLTALANMQVIDDTKGDTLVAASTLTQDIRQELTDKKSSGGNKVSMMPRLFCSRPPMLYIAPVVHTRIHTSCPTSHSMQQCHAQQHGYVVCLGSYDLSCRGCTDVGKKQLPALIAT